MNIFTHIAIGIRTKRTIEDMLPVKLNSFSFLYGSIKPDISFSFKKIPHYKDASIDYVIGEIEKLLKTDIDEYFENQSKYAKKLGILTHYLSDYFCYAHSSKFKGGIIRHYYYETKLMFYCVTKFGRVFNTEDYIDDTSEEIPEIFCFLSELLEKYSYCSESPSLKNDLTYTHEACTALCMSVLYPRTTKALHLDRKFVKVAI